MAKKRSNTEISSEETTRLKILMRYEKELYGQGIQYIAGLDEAGRGPIAGPVVAAAVVLPQNCMIEGVDDSKKLTKTMRDRLDAEIKKQALNWSIGIIFPPLLDDINIYQATKLAMSSAIAGLTLRPDHLIIDAVKLPEVRIPQTPLIKGDSLSISVASASILAKVERDRIMDGLEELYPGYGFAKHKGYATREHIKALMELGPCPVHRCSFEPVKSLIGGAEGADQGRLFD